MELGNPTYNYLGKPRICSACNHDIEAHKYSWSGPWDWWQCPCGCKIGT